HYIVMEYVEGENLKSLINREAPLPVSQAIAIAEAVAYGLESAHRQGMVHRDIKPQNIMVTYDGHVRITDFGIAKSAFSTALTQTGTTFGTADYISPEQASGQTASAQSDIYALGVTLYEMLGGKLPFTGDGAVAIAMQHVNSQPPPLRQLNPQVPYQLEALIGQAMAKDPQQRPGSAREFAHLLHYYRDMAEQQTIYSPRPIQGSDPAEARSFAQVAGAAGVGRGALPPARPPVQPAPKPQNHSCGMFLVGLVLLGGVLTLVLLLNTGVLSFDNTASGNASPAPIAALDGDATPTSTTTGQTATPTSSTPTPSPTPSPSPSPSPSPTATEVPRVAVPDIRSLPRSRSPQPAGPGGATSRERRRYP
ncbi:MAG: serine/threonine protein kinase, partial [Blastochloris sp.]|nr:serine/threonine protein kinase [Blastochloris sp.]